MEVFRGAHYPIRSIMRNAVQDLKAHDIFCACQCVVFADSSFLKGKSSGPANVRPVKKMSRCASTAPSTSPALIGTARKRSESWFGKKTGRIIVTISCFQKKVAM